MYHIHLPGNEYWKFRNVVRQKNKVPNVSNTVITGFKPLRLTPSKLSIHSWCGLAGHIGNNG